jgi:hypothetical protein
MRKYIRNEREDKIIFARQKRKHREKNRRETERER